MWAVMTRLHGGHVVQWRKHCSLAESPVGATPQDGIRHPNHIVSAAVDRDKMTNEVMRTALSLSLVILVSAAARQSPAGFPSELLGIGDSCMSLPARWIVPSQSYG